jgi:hypothetical protein
MRNLEPVRSPVGFRQYIIILKNNNSLDTNFHIYDGTVSFWDIDLTRYPVTIMTDAYGKLKFSITNYCVRFPMKDEYESDLEDITATIKKHYPDFSGYDFEEVDRIDIPYTPYVEKFEHTLYNTGCPIDSDSFFSWMHKHNIKIDDFITENKYIVIIEYAPSCFFKKLIEAGYIDSSNIENWDEVISIANKHIRGYDEMVGDG